MKAKTNIVLAIVSASATLFAWQGTTDERVDITVIGKDNVPVKSLTVADVTVAEDDLPRDVVRVEPDTRPVHVVWLTQFLPFVPTAAQLQAVAQAGRSAAQLQATSAILLAAFQAKEVHLLDVAPGSELSFVAWADPPPLHAGFSADAVAALKAASEFHRDLPMIADSRRPPGFTAIDIADIVNACQALAGIQAERAVVIIETGFPDEALAPRVEEALRQSGASLWVIADNVNTDPRPYSTFNSIGARSGLPGSDLPDPAVPSALRQESLGLNAARNLAITSGGWHFVRSLKVTVDSIATMLAAQQLVTYRRPPSSTAPTKLSVTVARKDTEVAAPTWPPK